jgi:hypothetical protein
MPAWQDEQGKMPSVKGGAGTSTRSSGAGVHGRRTGEWNGHKTYLLCAHCHNPHQPRFKAIPPMPAPVRPTRPGQ